MKGYISIALIFGLISFAKAQTRTVLIEQFTNSSCPPCATAVPVVYNFAYNNPLTTTVVSYHTLFPYANDSMHFENPTDANARVAYYGVNSTPISVFDGNVYQGNTATFGASIGTSVANRVLVAPRYGIAPLTLGMQGNELTGSIKFTSLVANKALDSIIGHVVVVEKSVLKTAYAASPGANSETSYGFVMRKMIPSALGTPLLNRGINETDTVNFVLDLTNIKNRNEVRVVCFVQNETTKEIYQAGIFTPTIDLVSLEEIEIQHSISVYPNPSQETFNVVLGEARKLENISIFNMLGELVYAVKLDGSSNAAEVHSNLSNGIYVLRIFDGVNYQNRTITVE
jgi:thiol-disulfide isomerase/thioredoxin